MNQNKPIIGWYYQNIKDKALVFVKESKNSEAVTIVPLVSNEEKFQTEEQNMDVQSIISKVYKIKDMRDVCYFVY